VTAYLCVVCYGCLKWRPAHWTFVWLTLGAGLLLLAPGQGALAIVATGPLALFVFGRGLLTERFSMLKWALVFAGLALLLGLFTPLGRMLWGAVRYGLEQSSINSAAHGIAWSNSFAAAPVNPWVFEIIRASWLIVTLWAGALILKMRSPKWSEVRPGVLAFALPVFLLGVLFIIRAAGRIDPVATTRLGFASIWALCLLLPLLLFSNSRNRSNASLVFIWVALAGGIFPHFGGARNIFPFRFDPIPLPSATAGFVIGSDAGLPALGAARINPAQLKRLVSINKVLGSVLEPDEPYLDMSGRGAQYFYLQRRPPIEAGSIYNLVGEAQQLRAIASLKHHQPKAILIGADNLLQDGGPASLRSPLLYRFVVLQSNFKHVSIDGFDWLIAEERLDRLPGSSRRRVSAINDNLPSKIQTLFKTIDLKYIPASWGRSAPSLESRMELIQIVNNDAPAVLHSVRQIESGHFQVTGKDPFVRYDLSPWNLRGRDAGVLGFDFSCERTGPDPVIEIFWASGRNGESGNTMFHLSAVDGRLIVPLDTDPGWLLAEEIKSLRIDVQDKESCSSFRIDNVSLFQRAHVGAND